MLVGIVLVLALPGRRRAGAVLRGAAIRRVGLIVGVPGFVAWLVVRVTMRVIVVLALVRVIGALAMLRFPRLAVLLMIGQFADFVTFAGPEEHE